jgi:ethanolamine utilization protein EutS
LEHERIIQVYVPGKEITITHLISNPTEATYNKLGIDNNTKDSIGIMKISPSEAAIILVDLCLKAANVEIGFMDRFSGTCVITGEVEAVNIALKTTIQQMEEVLGFNHTEITRS